MPKIDEVTSQKILTSLISLNGVLFGFTGVMVGLFLRNIIRLSEKTLKRCMGLVMVAFWCFIFSILFSFLIIGLGQEVINMPTFTPVFATAAGAFCSSIYLVMIFLDEYYPPKKGIAA